MSGNAFLSVAVVAATLNLSRQRIHQLIQSGKLPAHRWDGVHWVVYASDLEEYIGTDALEASLQVEVRTEWTELRRAILKYGGIGPSRDWSRDRYPGDLYRRHGAPPDLIAESLTLGSSDTPPWGIAAGDVAMFAYLERAYREHRAQLALDKF